MALEWLDNLLNGKQTKEAAYQQGENKEDHEAKKMASSNWIEGISKLDPDQVEKEYQDKLAQEAKLLGKTAAYEAFETPKETIEKDYLRDVKVLSDYALAEMLAELRCNKEQNTQEMFSEEKEKAKKEVASSREKAEKALLDLVPEHTMLDWKKAFERFSKEAKPEESKEKDLYQPKVTDKDADFSKPSEDKFKLPKDQEKAIPGNGREADERTDVTVEAGVLQEDITKGLGKEASQNKKADYGTDYSGWTNRSTWGLSLWLDNDQALYDQSRAMAKQQPSNEALAAELAATYNGLLEERGEEAMSSDEVNWNEIAQGLLDEEKENTEYEHSKSAPGVIESLPTMDVEQEKDKLIDALRTETDPEKMKALKRKYQHLTMASLKNHLKKQADSMNPLKREELPVEKQGCPVCGSMGKNLQNGEKDNMSCEGCGIKYACASLDTEGGAHEAWDVFLNGKEIDTIFYTADPKRTAEDVKRDLVNHDGYDENIMVKKGSQEIKSQASKAETIKKVAELSKQSEIQSPWVVIEKDGQEMIARRDISQTNEKVSEEEKEDELKK